MTNTLSTSSLPAQSPWLAPDKSSRALSVDALRGVVLFVMLYVNDVAGVRHLPWWMKHFDETGSNGMTFVDWVFGGFLFIVGLSIPLAFANRLKRGEPLWRLLIHVVTRTAGLLLLGFFMVNDETGPHDARLGMSLRLWHLLLFTFGMLAFLAPATKSPRARIINIVLRLIGFAGFVFLGMVYRNKGGDGMHHSWWGILGLIGWAYLTAAVLYLILRRREWLVAATFILMALFMFDHTGFFEKKWAIVHLPWLFRLHSYVDFGEMLGSQAAISMAGVVLGSMLLDPQFNNRERIRFALVWGLLLGIAALLLYPFYLINKNNATPTWCFICAAATCWIWAFLSLAIDVTGLKRTFAFFIHGGQNVLFAYLLSPLLMNLLIFFWPRGNERYYHLGVSLNHGIERAIAHAAIITTLAILLKNRGGRLQL